MKFECPHCGAKYEESQDVSGQEGECVECGRRFVATPMQESPDDTNAMFSEMRRAGSGSFVSGAIAILLIVFAVVVAGTGIASFNDSSAQSAIHQLVNNERDLKAIDSYTRPMAVKEAIASAEKSGKYTEDELNQMRRVSVEYGNGRDGFFAGGLFGERGYSLLDKAMTEAGFGKLARQAVSDDILARERSGLPTFLELAEGRRQLLPTKYRFNKTSDTVQREQTVQELTEIEQR